MFVKRDHEEGRGSRGSSKDSGSDLSVATSLLVAALAGAGNQLVTMPASVIATRMQESLIGHIDEGFEDSFLHECVL